MNRLLPTLALAALLAPVPTAHADPLAAPVPPWLLPGTFLLDGVPVTHELIPVGSLTGVVTVLIHVPCDPGNQGEIAGLEYHVPGINGVWWDGQGSVWTGVDVWRVHVDRFNIQVGTTCVLAAEVLFNHLRYYEWKVVPGAWYLIAPA